MTSADRPRLLEAANSAVVGRLECFYCDTAVSVEYVPDLTAGAADGALWTCPDPRCEKPNLIVGVRDIIAVWMGHHLRPRFATLTIRRRAAI